MSCQQANAYRLVKIFYYKCLWLSSILYLHYELVEFIHNGGINPIISPRISGVNLLPSSGTPFISANSHSNITQAAMVIGGKKQCRTPWVARFHGIYLEVYSYIYKGLLICRINKNKKMWTKSGVHFINDFLLLTKIWCKFYLSNSGLATPYGHIDLGQHWLRWWLGAQQHKATTWTNVDAHSWDSSASTWEQFNQFPSYSWFEKTIHLRLLSHLPGAKELIYCDPVPGNQITTNASHAMTELLVCYVHNFVSITLSEFRWEQNKIFMFELK